MENNKLLYAIFTIGIVILVLLIVQMGILIPMAMHGGHNQCPPQPVMSAAPAQARMPAFGCYPPQFGCHPHKFGHHFPDKPGFPPKPGFFKDQPKPGFPPKTPAEPQVAPDKPAAPGPQTK